MTKLICQLFGHRAERYGNDVCYGHVAGGNVDGIGREHWWLMMRCERCEAFYLAGRFHGPIDDWKRRERPRACDAVEA